MTDDLKDHLSRLADRASEPGGDALERLRAHRARRAQGRKLGTVTLAVVVAVAGSWGAFAAFRDADDRTAIGDEQPGLTSWEPPEVLTVWPENPVRGITPEEVQAAVDAGDGTLAWRFDPQQVARRFGLMMMGWSDVQIAQVSSEVESSPDALVYGIRPKCDADEGANQTCGYSEQLLVSMVQPLAGGDGGIWSVYWVESPGLQINLRGSAVTEALIPGSDILLDLVVPADRSAHIGFVSTNGCGEAVSLETGLGSGRHTITVPAPEDGAQVDPSCGEVGAGFVFAYAQDDTTVPVGDPLLEPAAIEYPWLTILPVYVEMGPTVVPPAPAAPLGVRCEGMKTTLVEDMTTTLDQASVVATAAGVSVELEFGPKFDGVIIQTNRRRGPVYVVRETSTIDLPPGEYDLGCLYGGDIVLDNQPFEVVDPDRWWVDPTLDCADVNGSTPDADAGPIVADDAEEAMRRFAERVLGMGPDGEVLPLGYPQLAARRTYGFVSPDGQVYGIVTFRMYEGGWFPDGYKTCVDAADF